MYNTTELDTATNFPEVISGVNSASDGFFVSSLIMVVFLLGMYVFKKHDLKTVMLGNSFLASVLAGLAWSAELIPFDYVKFPFLLLLTSIMIYLFTRG